MQKDNNIRLIAFTELMLQCVLFLSISCSCVMGIIKPENTELINVVWVIPAVVTAFAARKCIRKFGLFVLSNILIFVIAFLSAPDEMGITFNFIQAVIICVYSIGLKNKEVAIYKDNSIPVRDGQSKEEVRDAAIRSLIAKESVDVYLIAVMVVGYFLGMNADDALLMMFQSVLCILFVILQVLHNNLKHLKQEFDLNEKKKGFPASQMMQVSNYVTIISLVLISVGMLIFYNGYYGNIFDYMGAGIKSVIRLIMKVLLFIMGMSGKEQTITDQAETTTATEEEELEMLPSQDNDFMELLAEIFGMVLIVAIIMAVIYVIKVYASNFNKLKKVGTDTVEYVSSTEKKVRASENTTDGKKKESRSVRSMRKIYKKRVLKGMNGKKPDLSYTPEMITKSSITQDDIQALQITQLYEKARYSDSEITSEEYEKFKKMLE